MKESPVEYMGRKVYSQTVRIKGKEYPRFVVDFGTLDGKRTRRTFGTVEEAQSSIDDHDKLTKKIGRQATKLRDIDLLDAAMAYDVLEGRVKLETAARFYMTHNHPDGTKKTVKEVADVFIRSRQEKGCRQVTVQGYRDKLSLFLQDMGERPLSHMTVAIIEDWLRKRDFGMETRKSYLRTLGAFFQWAMKRQHMVANPARAIDTPRVDKKRVTYLSICDAIKLLRTTEKERPELLPYVAIAMFAGLRPSEIHGDKTEHGALDWGKIDFEKKLIELDPEQTKTRDGRRVTMSDSLIAWLLPYRQQHGPIHYNRSQFLTVIEKSGADYSKDILRHTAGTYLYAKTRHEGETAIQLGDTIKTVKRHYVNPMVEEAEAVKFWNIRPQGEGAVLAFPAQTA